VCYSYDLLIRVFYTNCSCIYILQRTFSIFKVCMFLTLCPSGSLTKGYLPWERKFPALHYLVCPERALAVGTGFLNCLLMFYYDDVNEWRGIKYTYIQQIVHCTEGHMTVYVPVRQQLNIIWTEASEVHLIIFWWWTGPYTAIWPEVTWTICYIILFI
jgi:hypothetical protein